jgi:hypothetical protein
VVHAWARMVLTRTPSMHACRYASMPHSLLCVWYAYIVLWQSDFYYVDGPVPNILRTNRVSYTELGISFGFFVVDMFVCLKYHVRTQGRRAAPSLEISSHSLPVRCHTLLLESHLLAHASYCHTDGRHRNGGAPPGDLARSH